MADRPATSPALETEYVKGVITVPAEVQTAWDTLGVKRVLVTIAGEQTEDHTEVESIMRMQHIEREVAEAMLSTAGVFVGTEFADRVHRLHATAQK